MTNNAQSAGDIRSELTFRSKVGGISFTKLTNLGSNSNIATITPLRTRIYSLNDYIFGRESTNTTSEKIDTATIPKIILKEYQPHRKFNWDAPLVGAGLELIQQKFLNNPIGETAIEFAGQSNYNKLFDKYAAPGNMIYNPIETYIKKLFDLIPNAPLGIYEIPLFSDVYIKADSTEGWSQSGSERIIGSEISKLIETNAAINFPLTPIWTKPTSDSSPLDELKNSFYLINETDEDLIRNFKFLNALASGNYWAQMDYVMQSPNVFSVEIPGRYHSYFCALGVVVEWVGKIRIRKIDIDGGSYNGINCKQFPDAYSVTVSFKDLCPNNFNNYIDYLKKGTQESTGKSVSSPGEIIEGFLGETYDEFLKKL